MRLDITPAGGGSVTLATTVVSETTAGQSPAVGVATSVAREDHTHGTPAAGAGTGSAVTNVEVSLGTMPVSNGSFTITTSGLTVGKFVMITQDGGPYTGKGTYRDEIEMDQVSVSGFISNATTILCNWGCWTKVYGNMKFNYLVGN